MNAGAPDAEAFARRLVVQAIWPIAAVAAAAVFVVRAAVAPAGSPEITFALFSTLFSLAAVVTVLLSLNLAFDAFLFRLIAGRANEAAGCAAVDDLLARMRLKQRPERPRGLQERITGTRRLMRRQRTALGACVAACLALWLARAA